MYKLNSNNISTGFLHHFEKSKIESFKSDVFSGWAKIYPLTWALHESICKNKTREFRVGYRLLVLVGKHTLLLST